MGKYKVNSRVRQRKGNRRSQGEAALAGREQIVNLTRFAGSGRGIPDAILTGIRYNDTNNGQFTNNTQIFTSRRWRLNSAYDPDPGLGSGSVQGFSEYAAMYNYYRVEKVRYEATILNKEPLPVQVIVAPTTADVGSNYSSIDELQELPFARNGACSQAGGQDRIRFRGVIPLGKLHGNQRQYLTDPQFAAAVNANPSTMYYLNIGAVTLGGAFTGNGLGLTLRLTYYVKFYDRKNVFSKVRKFDEKSQGISKDLDSVEASLDVISGNTLISADENVRMLNECASLLAELREKIELCSKPQ